MNGKICGTCRFWDSKSSSEETECFGRCFNEKTRKAIHLYIDLPKSFRTREDCEEKYHEFGKNIEENVEVRFEESFGCIHHEEDE